MTVSGILGWLNIRGVAIRVDLADEVYSGVATLVSIRLLNAKRIFPSFLLQVKLFGQAITYNLLRRGEEETASFVHVFPERGALAVPYGEICSPFPINFFVRCRRTAIDQRLLVFPAPLSCALAGNFGGAVKYGELGSSAKGYEGDVTRITDYTGSEPLKLIHWRLSAKHERYKVKELQATAEEPVILDLDAMPGKNLEENLSCAVFQINRLIRRKRPVGLKLRGEVITPEASRDHRLRLLAELAVYGKN
jgi:uncharacterized protein (DUF58 family)